MNDRVRSSGQARTEDLDRAIVRLLAGFECFELEEFRVRIFLRGLGFLDLPRQFRNRAFEIVAPQPRRREHRSDKRNGEDR